MCYEAGGYGGGEPEANAYGLISASLESEVQTAGLKMFSSSLLLSPMTAYYAYQVGKANMDLAHLYGEDYGGHFSTDPDVSGAVSLIPSVPDRIAEVSSPDLISASPAPEVSAIFSEMAASSPAAAEKVTSLVSVPMARPAAKRQTLRTGALGLSGAPITEKKSLLGS